MTSPDWPKLLQGRECRELGVVSRWAYSLDSHHCTSLEGGQRLPDLQVSASSACSDTYKTGDTLCFSLLHGQELTAVARVLVALTRLPVLDGYLVYNFVGCPDRHVFHASGIQERSLLSRKLTCCSKLGGSRRQQTLSQIGHNHLELMAAGPQLLPWPLPRHPAM